MVRAGHCVQSFDILIIHAVIFGHFRPEHYLAWIANGKPNRRDDLWAPEYLPGEGEEELDADDFPPGEEWRASAGLGSSKFSHARSRPFAVSDYTTGKGKGKERAIGHVAGSMGTDDDSDGDTVPGDVDHDDARTMPTTDEERTRAEKRRCMVFSLSLDALWVLT